MHNELKRVSKDARMIYLVRAGSYKRPTQIAIHYWMYVRNQQRILICRIFESYLGEYLDRYGKGRKKRVRES
jgi:hypothetical protein